MGSLIRVFFRAYTIVTCTALNVSQVAHGHYLAAFFTGSLLSWIWWQNTKAAATTPGEAAHVMYALGAGFGTVTGMALGVLLNGR